MYTHIKQFSIMAIKVTDNYIGYHTPKMTKIILDEFNENTKLKWQDSSWKHDETDSIYNEENDLCIYLPVSIKMDSNPTLELVDSNQLIESRYKTFDNIKDLYVYINKNFI